MLYMDIYGDMDPINKNPRHVRIFLWQHRYRIRHGIVMGWDLSGIFLVMDGSFNELMSFRGALCNTKQ